MSTKKTGPVIVELICEASPSTDIQEIDRAEWDAMTPGQRLANIQDMADTHVANAGGYGWHIANPDDRAAVGGSVPDDVDLPADPIKAAAMLDKLTTGLTVSVDVSTGDHDAYDRVFARVIGAQEDSISGGPMLLAEVEHDNRQSEPLRELAEWLVSLDDPVVRRDLPYHLSEAAAVVLAARARAALGKEN